MAQLVSILLSAEERARLAAVEEHNRYPKPFVWSKPADLILAKLSRVHVASV
jgi:hypothetical protein